MRIDLHTHSAVSDGTDTPAELVANAKAAGLDVVALTDHDTTGGWKEAADAARALGGIEVVPGAEISCKHGEIPLHMLAYLFDPDEPQFAQEREWLRDDRVRRAKEIVDRCRALGAGITWEQVVRIADGAVVGRPHVASALVEAGVVPDIDAAFTPEWLADGGRAFVDKYALDPFRAIRLIRAAGGVPVFAHPAATLRGLVVSESDIADFAEAGLFGIEVDHADHDAEARAALRVVADKLGLVATGSSDYHGARKAVLLGAETTAPEVFEAIVAAAA